MSELITFIDTLAAEKFNFFLAFFALPHPKAGLIPTTAARET
jgi:hypothetical protein